MDVDDDHYSIEAEQRGATQSGPETGVTWHQPSTAPGHALCADTVSPVPIIDHPEFNQLLPNARPLVHHSAPTVAKTWLQFFIKEREGDDQNKCVKNVTLPRDITLRQILKLTLVKQVLGIPEDEIPRPIHAYLDSEPVHANHRLAYACFINMMYIRHPADKPVIMTVTRQD